MTTLTLTTTLDAINEMLSVIGESPVSNLETQGLSDVAIAKKIFNNVSRQVQTRGWKFNSEEDVELPLDTDNKIPVPVNAIRVECLESNVVERGAYLYDLDNKTFTFSDSLSVNIVYFLEFEELPEAARWYITVKAARIFQDRLLGSDSLHTYTEKDELNAEATLNEMETDTTNYNMLTGSTSVSDIVGR